MSDHVDQGDEELMSGLLDEDDEAGLMGDDELEDEEHADAFSVRLAELEEEAAEEPENLYPSVTAFVRDFLVVVYARTVHAQKMDFRWCSQWWDHAEAVSRLEALWKAFETLRQDPGTGAAVWWRDYCDPTMGALCASDGAFRQCSGSDHKVQPDLPVIEPPPGFDSFGLEGEDR